MLELAAFLDSEGIPDSVLTGERALVYIAHTAEEATGARYNYDLVTSEQVRLALRALYRLSLIDHSPATPDQAVRVHQLIQRAVRDSLAPDRRDRAVTSVADALLDAWPAIEYDTALA
ncbi:MULTISPECIES: hypothetical protein [unclassified Streptomyces]|uniref:DUF7779 domain-containing protein n=1 Tax=Streptomyces sp. NBC_00060 TaxID=2975636 RepID=A0AAU2HDM3_9ACTN